MSIIQLQLPDKTLPNPSNGVEYPNAPITDIEAFKEYVNLKTMRDFPRSKKYYCLMLFYQQQNITLKLNKPTDNNWINTKNIYFRNGAKALQTYADTPCDSSILIDAETIEELTNKRNKAIRLYHKKINTNC